MTDREVMQQALYFVQRVTAWEGGSSSISGLPDRHGTLTALRTALEQQAEPPPEWESIKNILDEYGLDAIAFVAAWKAVQQRAEPVAYFDFQELKFTWAKHMKIGPVPVSIKVDPMKLYSEAAQRPWQGLTEDEFLEACQLAEHGNYLVAFQRIQTKLKEKNDY